MVVALVALVIALGGGAYALTTLPAGSVGTRQIRKSAIVSSKVRNRSLLAVDFKQGQLPRGSRGSRGAAGVAGVGGPAGPEGPAGTQGGQGVRGAQGTQGPSGIDGNRGATGATGSAGPSYGTAAFGASSSSTTGCSIDLHSVNTTISPSSTLRLFATGSAVVGATGTTGTTAFTARIEVVGGSDTLATVALPGTTSLAAGASVQVVISGVAALSGTPVDLFPGSYVVRLALTQTTGCGFTITVTSPQISMILVGTTP